MRFTCHSEPVNERMKINVENEKNTQRTQQQQWGKTMRWIDAFLSQDTLSFIIQMNSFVWSKLNDEVERRWCDAATAPSSFKRHRKSICCISFVDHVWFIVFEIMDGKQCIAALKRLYDRWRIVIDNEIWSIDRTPVCCGEITEVISGRESIVELSRIESSCVGSSRVESSLAG